jgi:hypothetical protein
LGVVAALVLLDPRASRSERESPGPRRTAEDAALCGAWHRATGEALPLDLERVQRAYADLKGRVTKSLNAALRSQPAQDLKKPYDAGLPACREDARRTLSLPPEQGRALRGRRFYFVRALSPSQVSLPAEIERDPGAQIFIVRARSLGDLPEIAQRLGRPVSLGSADFARTLGLGCANGWVRISEKGDSALVQEIH